MEEQGLPPISFREFVQQIIAGKAEGGRAGYQSGELVKPPGISDEEWNRIMFGSRGPRPLSSQSPFLSVHADGGRTGFQGGGADYMPTDPRPRGNPGITEEIENLKEFRIANPDMEDVADYKGYYERLKRLEELKRLMHGVQSEPLSGKWDSGPQPGSLEYWQMMTQRPQGRAYGGSANPTYTQSRKQRINAAGGGIMGSNAGSMLVAPTADGSRPGYGWNPFKAVKKVFKKVKEDIIPNEVKALAKSPVGKAALMYAGGAGLSSLAAGQGMGSLAQLIIL